MWHVPKEKILLDQENGRINSNCQIRVSKRDEGHGASMPRSYLGAIFLRVNDTI